MKRDAAKWTLLGLALALAVTSGAYRLLVSSGRDHSGLMFIGIPLVLSVLLILAPASKSPTMQLFKGITLFLLLVGVLAWEGLICIVMAAPLFYLVGLIVMGAHRWSQKRPGRMLSIALLPVLLLAFEGVSSQLSFPREHTIVLTRTWRGDAARVLEPYARAPEFDRPVPWFFRLGFPVPLAATATGSFDDENGVAYRVVFSGPADFENALVIVGTRVAAKRLDFAFVRDSTKIDDWMSWRGATLEARPLPGETTEIVLTLRYRRNLDPAWYFGPIEHYAVRLAGEHLLKAWIDE